MRKLLFLFSGIATSFGFSSCEKEYDCECDGQLNGVSIYSYTETLDKQSKSDAKAECDQGDYSYTYYGMTITMECELK
jgi:hypothetical protein